MERKFYYQLLQPRTIQLSIINGSKIGAVWNFDWILQAKSLGRSLRCIYIGAKDACNKWNKSICSWETSLKLCSGWVHESLRWNIGYTCAFYVSPTYENIIQGSWNGIIGKMKEHAWKESHCLVFLFYLFLVSVCF